MKGLLGGIGGGGGLAAGSSGLNYLGTWDANANSPALSNGSGADGEYYIVGTAGSTLIDGESDWQPGDWIISNGTAWQKIDSSDSWTVNANGIHYDSGQVGIRNTLPGADLHVTSNNLRNGLMVSSPDLDGAELILRTEEGTTEHDIVFEKTNRTGANISFVDDPLGTNVKTDIIQFGSTNVTVNPAYDNIGFTIKKDGAVYGNTVAFQYSQSSDEISCKADQFSFTRESDDSLLFILDDTNNEVTVKDAALKLPLVKKTSDYTITATDGVLTVLVDASSAPVTITLPGVGSGESGRVLNIKKIDSSANTVTIAASGASLIDDAATKVISTQYTSITLQDSFGLTGSNDWWII